MTRNFTITYFKGDELACRLEIANQQWYAELEFDHCSPFCFNNHGLRQEVKTPSQHHAI
jgi:hypothetical protein